MDDYNVNGGLPVGIDPLARAQSAKAEQALSGIYTKQELAALAETWTFTLEDGTTVTKKVVVLP